ncbi:unnamed protein product [Effrenium voratum]|nr:unnamed protein product [Effrenium voratum]
MGSSLALNAALAALQLEDWEAAEGFCSRALRWKSSAKAFYRRGLARVHLGFMADAKRDFNFALESEPRGSAAARQVQLELDKLAHRDGAAGLEAPPGADPQAAKRFEIANAAKQQQGVRQITWSEWSSTQQRVAAPLGDQPRAEKVLGHYFKGTKVRAPVAVEASDTWQPAEVLGNEQLHAMIVMLQKAAAWRRDI